MSINEMKAHIAAILTTALDSDPAFFPETTAYLALGGDDRKWHDIKSVLLQAGMIIITGHTIKLTQAGRDLARKIDALQKAAAKAREAAEATHHPQDFEVYREECKAHFAKMATPEQAAGVIATCNTCNAERDRQAAELAAN